MKSGNAFFGDEKHPVNYREEHPEIHLRKYPGMVRKCFGNASEMVPEMVRKWSRNISLTFQKKGWKMVMKREMVFSVFTMVAWSGFRHPTVIIFQS
ncbi:hypothetical protein ACX0G9_07860 [Flavitalea flava]